MDFSNIKVSIGIVVAIIAQAFGIIWYVAQLDSTVGNLSTTVDTIQEEKTTVDVAVLQNDIEALKEKIAMAEEFDASDLEEAVEIEEGEKPLSPKQRERKVKNMLKSLEKLIKDQELVKITQTATGVKMKLPKNSASITPLMLWDENLSTAHHSILTHLSGVCSSSLQGLQDATALTRAAARRELNDLIEAGHVEGYREGRGQSFRIA